MKATSIERIAQNYINGNISHVKNELFGADSSRTPQQAAARTLRVYEKIREINPAEAVKFFEDVRFASGE